MGAGGRGLVTVGMRGKGCGCGGVSGEGSWEEKREGGLEFRPRDGREERREVVDTLRESRIPAQQRK